MMKTLTITPPETCELCGKTAELRPYGPNGENICIDCGSKDHANTFKRMCGELFGDEGSPAELEVYIKMAEDLKKRRDA